MRLTLNILEAIAELIGLWAAFFVVVMSCFLGILWVHKRVSGERTAKRGRREA